MKRIPAAVLLIAAAAAAQTASRPSGPLLNAKDAIDLAIHLTQLMESTSAAVPGLPAATEAVRRNAEEAVSVLRIKPAEPVPAYRLLVQVRAYEAVAAAFPLPAPMPQVGLEQFRELREDSHRLQAHFEALLESTARSQSARDADPNNLKRYAAANAALTPNPRLPRVVFYGDSITDGWRLNEYFTGREFVNRGISGQTTTQLLGRFQQDVVALHPKAVLILIGINDIARGMTANAITGNLATMGDLARAHGIRPLFASVLPVSGYHKDVDPRYEVTRFRPPSVILEVNAWLKDYCKREGFPYVDYYAAMADASGQLPADQGDDGLHPNAKGYRIMAPLALAAIDKVLAAPAAAPAPEAPKKRLGLLPGK